MILPIDINYQKVHDPEHHPPDVRWDNFLTKGGEASQKTISSRMSAMIDMMKRNPQRLMHLVGQLLDISRMDAAGRTLLINNQNH